MRGVYRIDPNSVQGLKQLYSVPLQKYIIILFWRIDGQDIHNFWGGFRESLQVAAGPSDQLKQAQRPKKSRSRL